MRFSSTPGQLQSVAKRASANNASGSKIDIQFSGFDDLLLAFVQKLYRLFLDEHYCLVLERNGPASLSMHVI